MRCSWVGQEAAHIAAKIFCFFFFKWLNDFKEWAERFERDKGCFISDNASLKGSVDENAVWERSFTIAFFRFDGFEEGLVLSKFVENLQERVNWL